MFLRHFSTTGFAPLLAALAAGLLTNLAFEPFGYFIVAFFTLALLFRLWNRASATKAAWLGFLFGIGFFGVGINWIYISVHDFGFASPILAGTTVVLLATIMSLFTAISGYLQTKIHAPLIWRYLALIPAIWTLAEWTRGWLFTGFPWLYVGYSQTDTWLAGWAPLTSVLGVSLTVCTLAGMISLLTHKIRLIPLGIAALILLIGFIGSWTDWTDESFKPINMAVVQGDVSVIEKWDRKNAIQMLDYFVTESRAVDETDLIIWPEIALSYPDTHLEKIGLWNILGQHSSDFLVGTLEEEVELETTRYYNSAYGISENALQKYRKARLVPFGEYTPFRRWLDWLNDLVSLPASDMTAYELPQQPLLLAGQLAGVSICYEDAFPGDIIKMLPTATYLVNISEDAWFGDRLAPHQRLQMSRMRAIETARPVVRAANKGISASIDHRGQVIDQLEQSEGKVLKTTIVPTSGTTPFVRYGFIPLLILCVVLIGLSIVLSRNPESQID